MTLVAEASPEVVVHTTIRKIVITLNGKTYKYEDPNPSYNEDLIRQHFMGLHPELLNAKSESKKDEKGNETLTFQTKVAVKG